jgi:excisionase family DNA binding protein
VTSRSDVVCVRREERTSPWQRRPSPKYESVAQAAERTGVCVQTLRRRIWKGELKAYRLGWRIIRVNPDDVDSLLTDIRLPR